MGRKPKYNSEKEKKAALALAKKLKRSSEKEQKKSKESNFQWISQYLIKVADQVTQKVERQRANTNLQAVKRLAAKESLEFSNTLSERRKCVK